MRRMSGRFANATFFRRFASAWLVSGQLACKPPSDFSAGLRSRAPSTGLSSGLRLAQRQARFIGRCFVGRTLHVRLLRRW
jgi:hypothetical protein